MWRAAKSILLCASLTYGYDEEEFFRGTQTGMFTEQEDIEDYSCEDPLLSSPLANVLVTVARSSHSEKNMKRVKNKQFFYDMLAGFESLMRVFAVMGEASDGGSFC